MKKTLTSITLGALSLCSTIVLAEQATIDRIESAARQLDVSTLESLKVGNDDYDNALAGFRLAISYNVRQQSDKANTALDNTIRTLEELTKAEPENAEAWALLGHAYGTKISFSPMKGMVYGPKSAHSISKSKQLAPNNPRVYLVSAVSNYFTPALFGGSKSQAIKALDNAITAYADDESSGYHWGLADAYIWRGIVHMDLNDSDKAKADWQQALSIAPDHGWAQMLLDQNA